MSKWIVANLTTELCRTAEFCNRCTHICRCSTSLFLKILPSIKLILTSVQKKSINNSPIQIIDELILNTILLKNKALTNYTIRALNCYFQIESSSVNVKSSTFVVPSFENKESSLPPSLGKNKLVIAISPSLANTSMDEVSMNT